MRRLLSNFGLYPQAARSAGRFALCLAMISMMRSAYGQDTPLISGGAGFFSNTPGGQTSYLPEIQPVLAAPIGKKFLVESRALVSEDFFPNPAIQGYDHAQFIALQYLQLDYLASRHMTLVAGSFLTPFNVFNERLSQIWINPLQDGPLIESIADFSSGTSLGAELRGSAISRRRYALDYVGYFSARSGNQQFNAGRAAGGRLSLYLPEKRLEVGASYTRQLEGTRENFYGAHAWWEPKDTSFRLRSEYARGHHAQGYWVQADYRTQAFGGLDSWVGRIEPVFRFQQTFRRDDVVSDTLPATNTQRTDFGLDYNLPHNTRILTSYSRVFSAAGNSNLWETGIVYRFLFPTWKGK